MSRDNDYSLRSDCSKAKRASNREFSAKLLKERGYRFTTNNDGVHLMVECLDGVIDFWPGTGVWIDKAKAARGRGVQHLLAHMFKRDSLNHKFPTSEPPKWVTE